MEDRLRSDAGQELRVSRDCTVEDLELVMPGSSVAEREAFLAGHRRRGDVVTFAVSVVDEVPVSGLIIGPPGSERFLRRPGRPEHAVCRGRTDEEVAAVREASCRRSGRVAG